ncbi:uncharacterized protein UV8b_07438 [Ustilaginoidea virens]|uniref:JmjC domain-containing protein n=1 Tax=Ustilaginoidea virens TaxID=1159556 RepID=A0A8E5ML06_USTVR|nr:uncharacterized protein UV8b_07438 [Ustilaginoidea virens]QUC23197.1 hypothetical protein UV8b_07438 [Ustilaginoidea virens]
MPTSLHPQAKFDPFPPDLDLYSLVDRTPNFNWVQRVSRAQIRNLGQLEFEKLIQIHVIAGGKPLVIDGWDAALPKWLFNVEWLEKTYDKKQENVRDITAGTDIPMTTGHYLRSMKQLTNQWTPQNFRDERRQRLYLKDIDCPAEWRDALQKTLHPNLFYLNENVTTYSSSNLSNMEPTGEQKGNGELDSAIAAAPAGDLMSSLPKEMRAENLMCYIGHEGTYTPAHREMCASIGQNIMVEASGDKSGERSGSSIWFMTESKERDVVREYFLSMLGHDIEIEKHFAQINAWKKAPFDVYLVDQRPGDFIIIPPLAAHQVWNKGTRTMKVAWNRTTPETLRLALHEALPKARLVCRDEQYKNKAIIYYTLEKYHNLLQEMDKQEEITQNSFMGFGRDIVRSSPHAKRLSADFRSLFQLFTEILIDEAFAYEEKKVELIPFDSCITCSYCRSNIFNRFLTCKNCVRTLVDGEDDAYDICMECYAMGRSYTETVIQEDAEQHSEANEAAMTKTNQESHFDEGHQSQDYSAISWSGHDATEVLNEGPEAKESDQATFTAAAGSPPGTSYPDPSTSSGYGIGMGYYEQDDTPDKILFDPYKAPPAGAMTLNSLEVSDFVKRSIRAAKRKAKRENEDPDFIVGKPHHKRVRHHSSTEIMDNMDPALVDPSLSLAPSSSTQKRHQYNNAGDTIWKQKLKRQKLKRQKLRRQQLRRQKLKRQKLKRQKLKRRVPGGNHKTTIRCPKTSAICIQQMQMRTQMTWSMLAFLYMSQDYDQLPPDLPRNRNRRSVAGLDSYPCSRAHPTNQT